MDPKRKDPFDPKQIKKSLNSKASRLSFCRVGFRGVGVHMCDVGFRGAGFTFYSSSSQFASFSLDAFKPSIMFQSMADGVDPRHLTTLRIFRRFETNHP